MEDIEQYEKDEDGNLIREMSDRYECGHWTHWQVSYDKGETWHPSGYCRQCNGGSSGKQFY